MRLSMLLDMAADGFGDRIAVGPRDGGITFTDLRTRARQTATWLAGRPQPAERVVLIAENSEATPIVLYGATVAGVPFVPLNYRLADEQLIALLERSAPAVAIVDEGIAERVGDIDGIELVARTRFLAELDGLAEAEEPAESDADDIAVLLFTSGTTGDPKAAVLRHRHLTGYILSSVEFMGAEEQEAALVSVPPYHIAGISAVLSNTFAGRRIFYLRAFSPEGWVDAVAAEAISHAMVVPTMLGRVLDLVEERDGGLPSLRNLSYGGGRMPTPVVERALRLLPQVGFVNAYGLTETSSTIAVLGPEDHRVAFASDDEAVRARLGSVGRPLPSLEVEVRNGAGEPCAPGEQGEVCVRGEQVAGEYLGREGGNTDGWFHTRDGGYFDADGYLYLTGRMDDVIVRGAENISPGEIEDVLATHPAVADVGVCGVPDTEWGEKVVAAVVLRPGVEVEVAELQQYVRDRLRSSRMPEDVDLRTELPYNETGKLLRRVLRQELTERFGS